MKLSVIIVNYNVKYFLEQCLHSVMKAVQELDAEVIVVDNNSTDGSIEYLVPGFPAVIFIKNDSNTGFGKANNHALQSARGEYILFLNPDTIVPEDCFKKCIHFLDANPSAGACGIRMLDGSGLFLPESKRSFPTTAAAFYKLAGLAGLFPSSKKFNKYSLNYLDELSNHIVEVLAGAFMMIKKPVLDRIGGFDEQFFMYGEDIDLSYRMRQAGYENWYFAGSSIIHFKGESTKKESLKYLEMFYRAMIVFVNKHYKGNRAWITRSILKTGIGLRAAASLFGNSSPVKAKKIKKKTIVTGSDETYNECCRVLATAEKITRDIARFDFNSEAELLHRLSVEYAGTEIIFCNDTITYISMISIMQQLGPHCCYRFHAKGSNSIVGSDSKTSTGETTATH
jgi:GT2 family glycosyltransferase